MIFVDTNILMYAVGRSHPLRDESRAFLESAVREHWKLATSAEVLQELLHAYVPVGRMQTLDAALALVDACSIEIWKLEDEDVRAARALAEKHPALGARDLVHLACCRRRGVRTIKTFDRALAAAAR